MVDSRGISTNRIDRDFSAEPTEIDPTAPSTLYASSDLRIETPSFTRTSTARSIISALRETKVSIGYLLGKWKDREIDLSQIRGGDRLKGFFKKGRITMLDVDSLFVSVLEDSYINARNNILDTIALGAAAVTVISGCNES